MRLRWAMLVMTMGLALGLLAGEITYQWASADFARVKQITFMLANVDSIEHAERLAAESERLRPAWCLPGSDEVYFCVERSEYLWAGVGVGGVVGVLAVSVMWALARRRGREGREEVG